MAEKYFNFFLAKCLQGIFICITFVIPKQIKTINAMTTTNNQTVTFKYTECAPYGTQISLTKMMVSSIDEAKELMTKTIIERFGKVKPEALELEIVTNGWHFYNYKLGGSKNTLHFRIKEGE